MSTLTQKKRWVDSKTAFEKLKLAREQGKFKQESTPLVNQSFQKPNALQFLDKASQAPQVDENKGKWPQTLFWDEKEMLNEMKQDGISDNIIRQTIANKRKTQLPSEWLREKEAEMLKLMANKDVSSDEAVKMLKELRADEKSEEYEKLSFGMKRLKNIYDLSVWAAGLATGQVWNALDFVTSGKYDFKEQWDSARGVWERATWDSKMAKAWEIILGTWEMFALWPQATAPTMFGRSMQWAATLWLISAWEEVLSKWSDTSVKEVAAEWAKWAALWALLWPAIEKIAVPLVWWAVKWVYRWAKWIGSKWLQYWSTVRKWWYIKKKWLAPNKAAEISTKANRFKKGKEEKFIEMTWESTGEWATKRWMTKTWKDAVDEATNFFKQSINEANKWFEAIPWKFKITKWPDYILWMFDDLGKKLSKYSPQNKNIAKLKELYKAEWLTQTQINELKRIYAKNFKYTFLDAGGSSAIKSRDLQNWLREWQFATAQNKWFTNLSEINKTTQGWKFYADNLAENLWWKWPNNAISLTDWIALSWGEPTNVALFFGKKVAQNKAVKEAAIRWLSKQTKEPVVKASIKNILKTNKKANGTSSNILPTGNSSGGSKWLKSSVIKKATDSNNAKKLDTVIAKQEAVKTKPKVIKEAIEKKAPKAESTNAIKKATTTKQENYKLAKEIIKETDDIAELQALKKSIVEDKIINQKSLLKEIDNKIAWIRQINKWAKTTLADEYSDDLLRKFNRVIWDENKIKSGTKANKYTEIESLTSKNAKDFSDAAQELITQRNLNKTVQEVFEELRDKSGWVIQKAIKSKTKVADLNFAKKWSFSKLRDKNANYMIASAENPMWKQATTAMNKKTHKAFAEFMKQNWITHKAQLGKYWQVENSYIIKIDSPKQRKLIDDWLKKNSPQAENIIIKDGKAVRYDPRTKEAYEVDLTSKKIDLLLDQSADDFYSKIDGRKYQLPLYSDLEKSFKWDFNLFYNK